MPYRRLQPSHVIDDEDDITTPRVHLSYLENPHTETGSNFAEGIVF